MKTNLVTASVLLGATLLAAASPSGGTDQNRTVSVRTVVHTHDAASPGKTAPGPSGLPKAPGTQDAAAAEPDPDVLYLYWEGGAHETE